MIVPDFSDLPPASLSPAFARGLHRFNALLDRSNDPDISDDDCEKHWRAAARVAGRLSRMRAKAGLDVVAMFLIGLRDGTDAGYRLIASALRQAERLGVRVGGLGSSGFPDMDTALALVAACKALRQPDA